jgi:hypothetical protein
MLVLSFHLLRYAHHNIGQVFFLQIAEADVINIKQCFFSKFIYNLHIIKG